MIEGVGADEYAGGRKERRLKRAKDTILENAN